MAPPLVVLHSCKRWLPQTQTWIYQQLRFLPEDIESHVACESLSNLEQFPFPRIRSLRDGPLWQRVPDQFLRRLGIRRHLAFLARVARETGADLLHSHFGHVGWGNLGAARHSGTRHVVTFYGHDVNGLPREDPRWLKRYEELFAGVDRVLCEGPHMAGAIRDLGCPESKIVVHHLGIDLDALPFRPRRWSPGSPLRVLIAATFTEKKGIPYALEALARLRDVVPVEITLIGDATGSAESQQEKTRIEEVIARNGLNPVVCRLGFQPYSRLLDEAYQHHLFLSPSIVSRAGNTEGGAPVTLIEMAATGMPIVSTFHCDIPNVVLHEKTGLLARERDVKGLVTHLRWLVAHPDRWDDLTAAGRDYVEREFDARRQGLRLAAIYREVMAGRRESGVPRAPGGGE